MGGLRNGGSSMVRDMHQGARRRCVAPRRTRLLPRLVLAASVTMQQRLQLLPLLLRLLQRCPLHNSKSVGFVASASAS